jgi:hypothetical protein
MIQTKIQSRQKSYPYYAYAHYNEQSGCNEIVILAHCNTHNRLHEIGHIELGHVTKARKWTLVSQYITEEMEANDYAYSKCNQTLPYNRLIDIALQCFEDGVHLHFIFNNILKELDRLNYVVTREYRSWLWHELRYYEKHYKD